MGKVFKDKQGNVITKLLQFVATDAQVNQAITDYLDKNGVTLAEGVDLVKMASELSQALTDINGIKDSVTGLQQAQTNVLLQYCDHFIDSFEVGYIDNTTGADIGDASYIRSSEFGKLQIKNTALIISMPEGYRCALYFYNGNKEFQGATQWMSDSDTYKINDSQIGWYVRCVVYSNKKIEIDAINIILAGDTVAEILDRVTQTQSSSKLLGESELSSSDKLELNITKASLQSVCDVNSVIIPFLTDLHITCTEGKTPEDMAKEAVKIRRHIACYNLLAQEFDFDLCVYGGDYLNNSSQTNKATALNGHKAVRSLMDAADSSIPSIVGKGNHDDNTMYTDYKNGYVDSRNLYKFVTGKDARKSQRDAEYLERSYGCFDIPNKKVRVFMLNSDDVPTSVTADNKLLYGGQNNSGFGQEQIRFVAEHLMFEENGWQVIFFSHHPLKSFANADTEASGYTCSGVTSTHGGKAMLDLITAFKNKEKGSVKNAVADFEVSVEYDFTSNKSNTVIASICGHTHVYCHKQEEGIHYIATRAVLGHPTYNYISTSSYIVINRKARTLHLIANGDGDDYTYEY
nr:metallophosphoesterase [uncultured Blautia sp.]